MKQGVIVAPGQIAIEDLPTPLVTSHGVLVAVKACGLCTLEQRIFRGVRGPHPFAGGHELSGIVVGDRSGALEGALVAVSRLPRCGRCEACLAGFDNLCAYLTDHGQVGGPGGLSTLVATHPADLRVLPAATTEAGAALVEPLACVLNSLAVAGVRDGHDVAIFGNGFMGVLHARAAEALGARPVVLTTGPWPLGLEDRWAGSTMASVEVASSSTAFDAAIVIRDVVSSIGAACTITSPGGTVSIFASLSPDAELDVPAGLIRRKQLRLTAAASHRAVDFTAAADAIGTRSVRVEDLVHRRFPLDRLQEALEYASDNDTGRVLIDVAAA